MQDAFKKTINSFFIALPVIAGVLMLINFINPLVQPLYQKIFTGSYLFDPLIGALAGSISFGIPVVSYVTGGELLREGVSLLAVTAFILSWSSVGFITFPLEATHLGRRFALYRNGLNFISSIIISILAVLAHDLIKYAFFS